MEALRLRVAIAVVAEMIRDFGACWDLNVICGLGLKEPPGWLIKEGEGGIP